MHHQGNNRQKDRKAGTRGCLPSKSRTHVPSAKSKEFLAPSELALLFVSENMASISQGARGNGKVSDGDKLERPPQVVFPFSFHCFFSYIYQLVLLKNLS
jgi:hypothetical protein